jgi:hypothetical protein
LAITIQANGPCFDGETVIDASTVHVSNAGGHTRDLVAGERVQGLFLKLKSFGEFHGVSHKHLQFFDEP